MKNDCAYPKAEKILEEINTKIPMSINNFDGLKRPVKLNNVQKKLLENISEGKIISCPRNIGKSTVVKIYSVWLDWKLNSISHSEADEIITMDECIGSGLYSKKLLKEFMQRNLLHAIQEYNIDLKTLDKLQKEIEQEKELDDERIESEKFIWKVPSNEKIFF